jgi:hypothetical protein
MVVTVRTAADEEQNCGQPYAARNELRMVVSVVSWWWSSTVISLLERRTGLSADAMS